MRFLILWWLLALASSTVLAQQYDLVIEGGRVLDPETGLDATRNIGIMGGKIARISADPLRAKRVISAKGLVVAPGFIDLHQHGQDLDSGQVKALDGVTTALEMEIGVPDVAKFLKHKEGHSLINYGTTASHPAARALAFGTTVPEGGIVPKAGVATDQPASPDQIQRITERLKQELAGGCTRHRHGNPVHARGDASGSDPDVPLGRGKTGAGIHAREKRRPSRTGLEH